jgi:hypothetical protein
MPTISEPPLWELLERRAEAIKEFIDASPDTVSSSVDVLRARLFGLKLRGQDLDLEVKRAQEEQLAQRRSHILRIHQPLWGGFPKHWAQGPPNAVAWTENSSEAGRYTLQECAVIREQLRTTAPNAVVQIDGS